jgi:hypothetical protein
LALFDPVSITRAIETKPFSGAPNIVIAYPQRADWMKLYKPQPLRMPDAQGIYRNVDAFESRYLDMKRHHENTVLKRLSMIQEKAAGRAVIAAVKAQTAYSVYILPFDFLPSGDWSVGTGALTEPISIPQSPAERARGIKPAGTQVCQNGACWADLDSPTGKSVDIFYTASRTSNERADGWLLHELVHAARLMSGVFRYFQIGGAYGNQEEFYASTIEMIYRSEKGLPVYDYKYHAFDPATFLQHNMAIVLLTDLRTKQPQLFDALANVTAQFNPIKQLEDQRRRLLGR